MSELDLLKRITDDDVKFVSLQFTDLLGTVKSVDLPAQRVGNALDQGVWFDGSSVEGFARIQESDMLLRLDPSTYRVLPWSSPERRRARILCDIYNTDGTPFEGDPRYILKRQLARARGHGLSASTSARNWNSSCCATTTASACRPCRTTWAATSTSRRATKPSACAAPSCWRWKRWALKSR